MAKGRFVAGALVGAVLLGLAVLAFLVLRGGDLPDDGAPAAPRDTAAPEADAPAEGLEGRRHAVREGTSGLHGRVVRGKEETPAEGVAVHLLRDGHPDWATTTGGDGGFRFEKLPDGGPYTVAVDDPESAPVRLPGLGLERHQDLDVGTLQLDRAVAVTVQVRALDDTPVAGARVDAYANAQTRGGFDWTKRLAQIGIEPVSVASLVTDAAGEVHFDALAAGSWTFRASKTGFSRSGRAGVRLSADDPPKPVVLRLEPGRTLRGVVRDSDTGPLAHALVLAMRVNDAWNPQSAALYGRCESGDDGTYTLDGLQSGVVAIWAARAGAVPAQVALVLVPEVEQFEIELRSGAVLQGTVTEAPDGKPVADVEVRAVCYDQNRQCVGVATTDAEGRYVIRDLPDATLNTVTVERPGWLVEVEAGKQVWLQKPLPHGQTVTHDIRLRRGADLAGTVRGPGGPIADANLYLYFQQPGGGFGSAQATSDAAGRFRIQGIYAGKALLQVRATGHVQRGFPDQYWQALQQGTAPEEWTVEVPETGTVEREFVLERCGRIAGTVYGADGTPLAGARVSVWGQQLNGGDTRTAADGSYALDGLGLVGETNVNVAAEGHCGASQKVQAQDGGTRDGIDFHLVATKHVRGTVRAADGSAPKGAWVQIGNAPKAPAGDQPWQWQNPDRSFDYLEKQPVRADGSFELELRSVEGAYLVRAGADGAVPAVSDTFDAGDGRTDYTVDVTLGGGNVVAGRVVSDASGEPVAGARVAFGRRHPMADAQPWYDQNNVAPVVAVTDSDGRFTAVAAGEGAYKLVVETTSYVRKTQPVTLPPKGEIEVRLAAECAIAGVVHLADGTPVEGASITCERAGVMQPPTMWQPVLTAADGSFRLSNLEPGKYTLHVQGGGWNSRTNVCAKQLPGIDAGREDLDITVEAGLVISGRVVDDEGKGINQIWVQSQRESAGDAQDQWSGAQTADDGSFEIVGLRDGTFTLTFNDNGQRGYTGDQRKGVAAGSRDLVIRLTTGLEIEGVLVDEQGEPATGENLYAQALDESGKPAQTQYGYSMSTTDAKGHFLLRGLRTGSYALQRAGNAASGRTDARVMLGGERVAAGTRGLRLTLGKGAAISGIVVDESGAAVDGQQMMVGARPENGGNERWGRVAEGGSFTVEGLVDGERYVLRTRGGGYAPGASDPVTTGTEGVRIVVRPGLSAAGVLVNTRGDAIAKATVMLHGADDSWAWASTDEQGAFVVKGLESGSYEASAWIPATDGSNQRNVKLGNVDAGASGLRLEAPDAE